MRFTLTYAGPLKATQQEPISGQPNRMAKHKHDIRREFHRQLKLLWETNKFLRDHKVEEGMQDVSPAKLQQMIGGWGTDSGQKVPMAESVANKYRENGFRFVPLVREELALLCSLEILFLRTDYPGSVISAGDLDNRIKTLIDTLRRPRSINELRYRDNGIEKIIVAETGEDPFFCLLEDDKHVTELSVRTDQLFNLEIGNENVHSRDDADRRVLVVIRVEIKPYDVTMLNLNFA
jgi:hypothetical protein